MHLAGRQRTHQAVNAKLGPARTILPQAQGSQPRAHFGLQPKRNIGEALAGNLFTLYRMECHPPPPPATKTSKTSFGVGRETGLAPE